MLQVSYQRIWIIKDGLGNQISIILITRSKLSQDQLDILNNPFLKIAWFQVIQSSQASASRACSTEALRPDTLDLSFACKDFKLTPKPQIGHEIKDFME